jgi:MarR family transcriptional regulator, negative regulator of the multidrug operon emrRAB
MNDPSVQFQQLEANLERLSAHIPDLPVSSVVLSRLLIYLGRGMANKLEQQIRPFGLAEIELRVLTALMSQPDGAAHPGELCASTSQSAANMSRISDALVGRDLITRVLSQHDRRKMVLRITESGEELVRRLLPPLVHPLLDMFADFSEEEQRLLIAQLKLLATKLHEAMAQDVSERAG